MTKRTSAKYKLDRRMGENIWGRAKSPVNRREYGPGQHGRAVRHDDRGHAGGAQAGEQGRLGVGVQPGGCSGLIYQLYFDERVLDGDTVRDYDGVEVIVDKMSVPYLMGATIDFEDTISKQGFTIDNPNAGGSCACGDSFH